MGSLPRLFRPKRSSFPGTPYLKADPAKVAAVRARLPEGRLRGDLEDVVHQFGRWVSAGGVKFAGLVRRRTAEANLFQAAA
ncbi:MAG: hypothetical protein EXQ90_05765 [Rhodospirillales bacterium]|nr:hypothetical protein [Rhodospirillales bacterium]